MLEVKYRKLHEDACEPSRAHEDDAGLDLYAYEPYLLRSQEIGRIQTGIAVDIPSGYVGYVFVRSGLSSRGILLANGTGVVDAGYHGELQVVLFNSRTRIYQVSKGDRVAQMVIMPIPTVKLKQVDAFAKSERGAGGFGSSGI